MSSKVPSFIGVAGFVASLCALPIAFVPLVGVVPAGLFAFLGLTLSLVALVLCKVRRDRWDGYAVAGLCMGLGAVVVGVAMNLLLFWAMDRFMLWVIEFLEELVAPLQNYPAF